MTFLQMLVQEIIKPSRMGSVRLEITGQCGLRYCEQPRTSSFSERSRLKIGENASLRLPRQWPFVDMPRTWDFVKSNGNKLTVRLAFGPH